ncbi:MAG: Uncharacterised protein [Cryomorphaceae bacterium]|nr:MAG: Uncharacterised protein [Cryomorphaceae bacterium]
MDGLKVIFNWDYLDVLTDKILIKSISISHNLLKSTTLKCHLFYLPSLIYEKPKPLKIRKNEIH